jgi:predicted ribonuclease YlaK
LPEINTECDELFTTAKPILTSPKIIGKIDLSQFEKRNKTYVIDANVFLDCPDIIQKIDKQDNIVLSAKVIDELDSLKVKLPDKLDEINTAFRIINRNMEGRKIMTESADLKLLPADFNKKSPDNFILSVAIKCKENNPILLTSDNGLQIKAKGMKIKTKSLVEFIKSSKK